jgi:hypothetical protein
MTNWVDNHLSKATSLVATETERKVIELLLGVADTTIEDKLIYASLFDFLVSLKYYESVGHTNWLYCADPSPILVYPYTNTCPQCLLKSEFVFHRAHKPKSGIIGATTARLLALFVQQIITRTNQDVQLLIGREPIDIIILDKSTTPTSILFAEIKASPLVTLPLSIVTQRFFSDSEDTITHISTTNPQLFGQSIQIAIPEWDSTQKEWKQHFYFLGIKENERDSTWCYRHLEALLLKTDFLEKYFAFWRTAYDDYATRRTTSSIYWLTNGCGQPSPMPSTWQKRLDASGYESISDGKTSVGMDRTDDIKKATYQVLKLNAEGKPNKKYNYKVGILSNIHAVRHYVDYLENLQDIVWTRYPLGKADTIAELPADTPLFHLFDGIIALTHIVSNDDWIQQLFVLR